MSKSVTIGARISEELDTDLERLAVLTGRSRSWLLAQALRVYITSEQQFMDAVQEGLAALRAGELVEHRAVVRQLQRRIQRSRR